MSALTLLPGRTRDLGGFSVRRSLPSMMRRMVGPFVFWDHMGPVRLEPGHGMDVRPHPHIGLATVTYLFEGEIVHRDSLGSDQPIRSGDVNWMTAGRGIVHSERTAAELRNAGPSVHGLQSWVALPLEREEDAPSFQHVARAAIPETDVGGVLVRIIAGTAFGETSPVRAASPLFYVEARMAAGQTIDLPEEHAERAAYVVAGTVQCGDARVDAATMAVADAPGRMTLHALEPTRLVLLGGAPLGKRHVWWNFVSSSEARIEQAKEQWRERGFPRIPGDDVEFIPLPER